MLGNSNVPEEAESDAVESQGGKSICNKKEGYFQFRERSKDLLGKS